MKALRVIGNILCTLVLILGVVALILYACGFRYYTVRTASMQTAYPVGSLIITAPCEPSTLERGDAVSIVFEDGTVLTHRVVYNDTLNSQLVTQGDENNAPDAPTSYDNVLGRVVFHVPAIGYFLHYARWWIVGIVGVGIVAWIVLHIVQYRRHQEAGKASEE